MMNMDQLNNIFSAASPPPPPFAGPSYVHDFSQSSTMLLDENQCLRDAFKVDEVSKFTSPPPSPLRSGSAFVATEDVLAYSLKEGSIRLIHRPSGSRQLLKAHGATVTDMCFADTNNLITCAEDGLVIAWSISVEQTGDTEFQIHGIETLRIRCGSAAPRRVVIHPRDSRLLFVAHGSDVSGVVLAKPCWEAYQSLPDRSAGLKIEHIAQFRLYSAHQSTINEVSFNHDGNTMLTAGDDETVLMWDLVGAASSGAQEVHPISRIALGAGPVSFARFYTPHAILVGFSQSEQMIIVSAIAPHHSVLAKARFSNSTGAKLQLRAQLINEQYVIMFDANSPLAVLLQVDADHYFRRAVCMLVPQPVINFSLTRPIKPPPSDAVDVNAIGGNIIYQLELTSIAQCFQQPQQGGMLPPVLVSRTSSSSSVPAPPPPHVIQQQQQQMMQAVLAGQQQHLPQRMASPPLQRVSPSPTPPAAQPTASFSMDAMDRLLQEKLEAMMLRIEHNAKEQQDQERVRTQRLLEAISGTLRDLPKIVSEKVNEQVNSPQFQDMIGQIVQSKLQESAAATQSNSNNPAANAKALEKSLKTVLPHALEKFTDQVSLQVVNKLGLGRHFEDAFVSKLVPAFEAGVRDIMGQFEDFYSQGGGAGMAGVGAGNAAMTQSFERAGLATPEKRDLIEDQVSRYLAVGNNTDALRIAVDGAQEFPQVLLDTCGKVNLNRLLLGTNHGLSQNLLMHLMSALALHSTLEIEPMKCLEWMEAVSLVLDPTAKEISKPLPNVIKEAREALIDKAELFEGSTRFRAVVHILGSLCPA